MVWPPRSEVDARFDPDVAHVVWEVTLRCNLDCPYCFGHRSEGPVGGALKELGAEHAARVFREAAGERRLYFDLTGGEPLLVEEVLALMELLPEERAYFRIQTNGTVYRHFRPAHLNLAYQPLSMLEAQASTWWENLSSFVADGHLVTVQLIALPDRLDELEELYGRAAEIVPEHQVYVRYLQGQHAGRQLPRQYRREELARLKPMMSLRAVEEELCRLGAWNFSGRVCRAGRDLAVVFEDGGIHRCTGARAAAQARMGDLAAGFRFSENPARPCEYPCSCVFQGFWYCLDV